jgi:type I restriction enzyme, S subunit
MKKYDKYKKTRNIWFPELPSNWILTKVKYVARTIAGGTPSTDKPEFWDNGNIPWLPSGKLQNCDITTAEKFITEEGLNNSSTKWIKPNTTLIALTGATCANIGYLKFKACANQSVVAIDEVSEKSNSRFMYYMFLSMRKQILTHQSGGAQAGINDSNVKNLYMALPSLEEQTKIAHYLDNQTAIIDQVIKQKEKLIELLKEKRQSVINEAVTKGLNPNAKMKDSGIEWLGQVPKHWKVARIGHYTQLIRGASPRPAGDPRYFGGDFMPWITVGEVTNGDDKFVLSTENYLTKEGSEQSRIIYPETLLLSNSGATLGVPKISKITGCINDGSVAFISLSNQLERDFLFYFFKTHTETYRQEMSGYGQPNLNTDIIKSTKIPLPPINEQIEIVNFIENEFLEFDKIISLSALQIDKMKEYRQSIISEAVTGKIDVRDWQPSKKQVA